jgi:hypothetical protein
VSQENKPDIIFEVYPKRALHEPFETLPLLDRDTSAYKAQKIAKRWGALVIRMEVNIISKYPMVREVLKWEVVFVSGSRLPTNKELPKISKWSRREHYDLVKKLRKGPTKTIYRKIKA